MNLDEFVAKHGFPRTPAGDRMRADLETLPKEEIPRDHSCSCHVKNAGPCMVCKEIGCEVWDFNEVAITPLSETDPEFPHGGIMIDSIYVPPIGFYGFKNLGEKVWGPLCIGVEGCEARALAHHNGCPEQKE